MPGVNLISYCSDDCSIFVTDTSIPNMCNILNENLQTVSKYLAERPTIVTREVLGDPIKIVEKRSHDGARYLH